MTPTGIDRDNAALMEQTAAEEFRAGRIADGLYFLDAADYWAEPSPETVSARIVLLQQAMETLSERTEAER